MSKKLSMNVVNQHACGIDVGSRSHWVSVGQGTDDLKEYGVYSEDYRQMIIWLKHRGVLTIAMESTGSYWQTLFSALQEAGFEVLLVNGQQTKNHKGKTDIKDCQWIQKLHSLGMLSGSFLPSHQVEQLRTYQRHRTWMVEQCSKLINKMQKSLRLMNFRLDIAVSDISGKSGMRIIKAILEGERDGSCLAELADGRIKKSKIEIAKALQGSWNEGLMYELRTCFDLYQDYKNRLDDCDKRTAELLNHVGGSLWLRPLFFRHLAVVIVNQGLQSADYAPACRQAGICADSKPRITRINTDF
ncbi:MAG: transposase [Bacteroidales bacterium]